MRAWRKLLPVAGIAAAMLVGSTGCASVYRSSQKPLSDLTYKGASGTPSELVCITTTGYYLFWSIPLISGDLRWNKETKSINGGTRLFSDMVGITELQDAIHKMAETRNCDAVDVSFRDSDTTYAEVSTGGIIGMFFGSSEMSVSAVFVPRSEKSQVKEGGAE